jgi:hypothetical protein
VSDADNAKLVAYCYEMGLSSNLSDHLYAFLNPKYLLKEFDLILYLQKLPSYQMQFLFYKCLHYDKPLLEENVMQGY